MVNVKDKWALITGAARGIGYLSSLLMADQGCNLILHSRDLAHTEKVIQEVRAKGVQAYAVAAELDNLSEVDRILADIDALGVPVDIELNNAGLQIAYRTEFFDTPVEDYEVSFRVNTIAPAMICYHFMPKMIERGFGRILNTTSGIRLEPEQAGYSASKAALDKVTMDLANVYDGTKYCGTGFNLFPIFSTNCFDASKWFWHNFYTRILYWNWRGDRVGCYYD